MADLTPNVHLSANTLIKQPTPGDLRMEPGSMQLVERWKGRYQHCTNVVRNMYNTSADIPYSRFTTAAGNLIQEYPTALPPPGLKWTLAQATVDEIEAGENAILQCIWNAELSAAETYPTMETWSVDWQAENYDPYAYCANPDTHISAAPYKSQRIAVEQCLQAPIGNNSMTEKYLYQYNNGLFGTLNPNEQKILDWKLQDLHVIKHHPVITKQYTLTKIQETSLSTALAKNKDQVLSADIISDVPVAQATAMGFPGYTWVCQGTNIQTSQADITKNEWRIDYRTSWLGSLSVVQEFYSANDNTRWEFGVK